jgi:hypothetical protein
VAVTGILSPPGVVAIVEFRSGNATAGESRAK